MSPETQGEAVTLASAHHLHLEPQPVTRQEAGGRVGEAVQRNHSDAATVGSFLVKEQDLIARRPKQVGRVVLIEHSEAAGCKDTCSKPAELVSQLQLCGQAQLEKEPFIFSPR